MTDQEPSEIELDDIPSKDDAAQSVTDQAGDVVQGDVVQVENSAVNQVNAEIVNFENSVAISVGAQDVHMMNSAAVFAETSSLEMKQNNMLLFSNISEAVLNHSQVGTILSGSANLTQSGVGVMVARDVQAGSLRTGLLLAGRVDGPVEALLDTPRVLLAGLVAGITMGLVMLISNLIGLRRR